MSFWQILGIVGTSLGWIAFLASPIWGPPTRDRLRARRGRNGWETHPCKLPTGMDLPTMGQVWRCHCGRRWKYLRQDRYDRKYVWEERTPELELAEAEKMLKRQLGEK